MIIDCKKEFFKKAVFFVLKKDKLEAFLVLYNECLTGIKWKGNEDVDSLICCKTNKAFYNNV